jgi:hypothetical protein
VAYLTNIQLALHPLRHSTYKHRNRTTDDSPFEFLVENCLPVESEEEDSRNDKE